MFLFKASGKKNYSIEAFTLLCQFHFIFLECMKQQLLWSRTVSVHGRRGGKLPNSQGAFKECKTAIAGLGANVTEQAVKRIRKCLGETAKISSNFDSQSGHTNNLEKWMQDQWHNKLMYDRFCLLACKNMLFKRC